MRAKYTKKILRFTSVLTRSQGFLPSYRPVCLMSSWNSLPCLVATNCRTGNPNWYYEAGRGFKVGWLYQLLSMDMTVEIPETISFAGGTVGQLVPLTFHPCLQTPCHTPHATAWDTSHTLSRSLHRTCPLLGRLLPTPPPTPTHCSSHSSWFEVVLSLSLP